MKGIVFREFIDMIENHFGEDMVDNLIETTKPASGGSYTTVGTYDHNELLAMVKTLSKQTGISEADLVHSFGKHLAGIFSKKFPAFFDDCPNTFEFLKKIDNHIHVEVKKLYPDAELPKFTYIQHSELEFELIYESQRNFSHLAHGLIEGCMEYFKEAFQIHREDILDTGSNTKVAFKLRRLVQ